MVQEAGTGTIANLREATNDNRNQQQTIRQHATQSQKNFVNILHGLHADAAIIQRLPRLFEQLPDAKPIFTVADFKDEFEQFRVWASSNSIFTSDHASLDHRLREAPDMKRGIAALMVSLNTNLEETLALLKADRQYDEGHDQSNSDCDSDDSSASEVGDLSDSDLTVYELQDCLEHISDIIDKLSHLARIVRTSGISCWTVEAANYIHYEMGVNQTEVFEMQYLPVVLKDRYGVPNSLLTRLCQAISLRRRRFMFNQKNQEQLFARNEKPSEASTTSDPILSLDLLPEVDITEAHKLSDQACASSEPRDDMLHPIHAVDLHTQVHHTDLLSTSVSSASNTVVSDTRIPPAPQLIPGQNCFQCPYCCLPIENEKALPEAWKNHVIHDLQPFICIENSCSKSNVVLGSWTDWIEHHKWSHALEWFCDGVDGHHRPFKCAKSEHYSDHLYFEHSLPRSSQDLKKMLKTDARPSQEPFHHCPFCDFKAEPDTTRISQDSLMSVRTRQAKLQRHIFQHLLSLFILALPGHVVVDDCIDTGHSDFRSAHSNHESRQAREPKPDSYPEIDNTLSSFVELRSRTSDMEKRHPVLDDSLIRTLGEQGFEMLLALLNGEANVSEHKAIFREMLTVLSREGHVEVLQAVLNVSVGFNIDSGEYDDAMQEASRKGRIEVVRLLLDAGENVSAKGKYIALRSAASDDHIEVAKFLLDHGAQVDERAGLDESNALEEAAAKGHVELVQMLLDYGAAVNASDSKTTSALQLASENDHLHVVQILLNAGADVHVKNRRSGGAPGERHANALLAASAEGCVRVVHALLGAGADIHTDNDGLGDALRAASKRGHVKVVQALIDADATARAQGTKILDALDMALAGDHLQIVQMLLKFSIDIDKRGSELISVLNAASLRGSINVAKLLIDHGAHVDAQDNRGRTALTLASKGGHFELVKLLINSGADVKAQGTSRESNALQEISARGNVELVQMLLDHGADVNAQGGQYGSALRAALIEDHTETVHLLCKAGAVLL